MMLMVCNQLPSTSNYVPLMSTSNSKDLIQKFLGWYYMGIIFVIVFGTFVATLVLFVHSRKAYLVPLPYLLRVIITSRIVHTLIVEPSSSLVELWTDCGVMKERRVSTEDLQSFIESEVSYFMGFHRKNFFMAMKNRFGPHFGKLPKEDFLVFFSYFAKRSRRAEPMKKIMFFRPPTRKSLKNCFYPFPFFLAIPLWRD